MFIESQSALVAFAERARTSRVLAIDTEFLREKTYYPKLCLLQMQTDTETAIVDPFKVSDLRVLSDLFTDPNVMKLFHAATQDLEIIYREMGVLPTPLFDTQVAAALLGHTQQMGYGSLVYSVCGVQLKKADSFTDWSRRPLSNSQVKYAADDVIYLPKMYAIMTDELRKKGRLRWLDADFDAMSDPARFAPDERERYKRLKRVSQLNRRQLSAARELAAWRESAAQRRNIPRKWVVTDEQIVEACKREPATLDELFMVRGLQEKLGTKDSREVLACIQAGLKLDPEQWPKPTKPSRSEANVDVQVDLISCLVRLRARENDIAFQTLANHSDLAAVARGYTEDVELLQGWRREIVGEEILRLMNGELTLSIDNGEVQVTAV